MVISDMTEYCDCTRPNEIGRNNPCFDCGKPIEICGASFSIYDWTISCIKMRGHENKHMCEVEWSAKMERK